MMSKTVTFTGIMLAAALVTLHFTEPAKPSDAISNEQIHFDEETTNLVVSYQAFKDSFAAALQGLERREIDLSEATVWSLNCRGESSSFRYLVFPV